jgi:hypothetical protein
MLDEIELKDWVTISAIIIGPILAIQAQKILEAARYKKQRRLNLFHTLMSTRATRVSNEHVAALNMIDIEFYGRKVVGHRFQTPKEKSITNAWKNYNDQLNTRYAPEQFTMWIDKGDELFTTLLYKMSNALGYDFDEVQLKRDCYRPVAHGNLEQDEHKLRTALIEVMEGRKPLPIRQFEEASAEDATQENS